MNAEVITKRPNSIAFRIDGERVVLNGHTSGEPKIRFARIGDVGWLEIDKDEFKKHERYIHELDKGKEISGNFLKFIQSLRSKALATFEKRLINP